MPRLPEPPAGLQARCDQVLADLDAALTALQETYRTEDLMSDTGAYQRGRYFQGIRSHAVVPSGGNETAPDKSRRPTDQAEDWTTLAVPLPATMPLSVQVDTYVGPLGSGWVLVGELEIAGRRWRRAIGHGPEARTQDWTETAEGLT